MALADTRALRIGFYTDRISVELRSDAAAHRDLAALGTRFASSTAVGSAAIIVPLDDFLADLSALADWPGQDVVWNDDVLRLVQGVVDDAEAVSERLIEAGDRTFEEDTGHVAVRLGASWTGGLTEFQTRNVGRLLTLRHGADFSVPGAGKTREALAVFTAERLAKNVQRALVVCPKSAYDAWSSEAAQCLAEPLTVVFHNGGRPNPAADILVVNYERLDRSLAHLAEWLRASPAMMILDEAHRMKLGSAGVYGSACMALGPLSARRLILTGTPAPNGAKDLENLFAFVWPGHGRRAVVQAVAGGNLARASRALKPLYVRTTKKELGLPSIDLKLRRIALEGIHGEIYAAIEGRYSARAEQSRNDFRALGRAAMRLLMAASSPALLVEGADQYAAVDLRVPERRETGDDSLVALLNSLPAYEAPPKYVEARKIVADNAAAGRKTIVWTSFIRGIHTLRDLLYDLEPAIVHGGTADDERHAELSRFRSDEGCWVLISNPATLGEGISLHQVCHDAVFIDRDFQAGRFIQSLDRIHRLGMDPDAETRITVLVAEGTVDAVVAQRLDEKIDFLGKVLDDPGVQELADLEEEASELLGMDTADIRAFVDYLLHKQDPPPQDTDLRDGAV